LIIIKSSSSFMQSCSRTRCMIDCLPIQHCSSKP
jgi:hypothetical protein